MRLQDKIRKSIKKYFYYIMKVVKNNMTTISVRIEDSEKEFLQKYAKENDLSLSWVVRKSIKEFIEKNR